MWMDLSQADYGLSLLNDCKYGHEAYDGMMALTLLKCPKYPDPHSDREEHFFTYSLFPHPNDWRNGKTIQQALDLNNPLYALFCENHNGHLPERHSFITINNPNVTLEAIKKAEHSDELILRLVEKYGSQCDVKVCLDSNIKHAFQSNLLEREDKPAVYENNELAFNAGPYEINTFKVKCVSDYLTF